MMIYLLCVFVYILTYFVIRYLFYVRPLNRYYEKSNKELAEIKRKGDEATEKVFQDFRDRHPEIDWKVE